MPHPTCGRTLFGAISGGPDEPPNATQSWIGRSVYPPERFAPMPKDGGFAAFLAPRSEPDWHDCSIHLERPIAQRINAGFYFSIVSRLQRKNF